VMGGRARHVVPLRETGGDPRRCIVMICTNEMSEVLHRILVNIVTLCHAARVLHCMEPYHGHVGAVLVMAVGNTQKKEKMMRSLRIAAFIALVVVMLVPMSAARAGGGFDEFGYNDRARIFVGPADGVDRVLDGAVWGDPTYANDHLVMKWNAEWDRGNDEGWGVPPYSAWTDNEWNGMVPGGSGETWHYKIVWVDDCGALGTPVAGGGYCVWNQFAVILSQGTAGGAHLWDVLAAPAGYGGYYPHP